MSMVIDGKDILACNSYLAIVMSESLDDLLNGRDKEIPAGILRGAKNLFSVGMDFVREKKGLNPVHQERRETLTTYKLLKNMLKSVKKVDEKRVDSELEKLAIAMEVLAPDGRQVCMAEEQYRTLRNLFEAMYRKSCEYIPAFGQYSPYIIGTFDSDDE